MLAGQSGIEAWTGLGLAGYPASSPPDEEGPSGSRHREGQERVLIYGYRAKGKESVGFAELYHLLKTESADGGGLRSVVVE